MLKKLTMLYVLNVNINKGVRDVSHSCATPFFKHYKMAAHYIKFVIKIFRVLSQNLAQYKEVCLASILTLIFLK